MSQEFQVGDIVAGQDNVGRWVIGPYARFGHNAVGVAIGRQDGCDSHRIHLTKYALEVIHNAVLVSPKQPRSLNSENSPSGENKQSSESAPTLEARVKAIETWILEKARPSFGVVDRRLKRLEADEPDAPDSDDSSTDSLANLLNKFFGKKN